MPTHVYANNNEIASKASEGKSIAAFPDVCFSPPAPPVGPMPLPYPNTGEATNTDKGTSKVFIKDKMVGMGDDSYFSKSMGDESATQNFTKGMITSALQGKCYFGLWSMDVQMEGKGVPRHLDMVTHNHASQPSNILGQFVSCQFHGQNIINKDAKQYNIKYIVHFVDKNDCLFKRLDSVSIYTSRGKRIDVENCNPIDIYDKSSGIFIKFDFAGNDFYEKGKSTFKCSDYYESNVSVNSKTTCFHPSVKMDYETVNCKCIIDVPDPTVIFIGGAGDLWSCCLFNVAELYSANNKSSKSVYYYTYNGFNREPVPENKDTWEIIEDFIFSADACKINYKNVFAKIEDAYKRRSKIHVIAHSWGCSAFIKVINVELSKKNVEIDTFVALDPVGNDIYYDFKSAIMYLLANYDKLMFGIQRPELKEYNIVSVYPNNAVGKIKDFVRKSILYASLIRNRIEYYGYEVAKKFSNGILSAHEIAHEVTVIKDFFKNCVTNDVQKFVNNLNTVVPVQSCKPKCKPKNINKFVNVFIDYSSKKYNNTGEIEKIALLGVPWQKIPFLEVTNDNIKYIGTHADAAEMFKLAKNALNRENIDI